MLQIAGIGGVGICNGRGGGWLGQVLRSLYLGEEVWISPTFM